MSRKPVLCECNKQDNKVCAFCGTDEENEVLYGKYIVSEKINMHTYCLFFASGLSQEGDDSQEYFGFLLPDIEAELRRGRKLFCSYCKKRGATIGCCLTKCKKSFHLNCGIKNGSLHQFFDTFRSYCEDHKPKQKLLENLTDLECVICCESIEPREIKSCLYSPCCQKNFFHKFCLQKYALSAGMYFFKCPMCNNSSEFLAEMKKYGINIPEKDASWELEENAYQELLVQPECDLPICLCPKGRNHRSKKIRGWNLLICSYCGSHATHKNCANLCSGINEWLCGECKDLDMEMSKQQAIAHIEEKPPCGIENELESFLPALVDIPSTSNLHLSPKVILENCLAGRKLPSNACFKVSSDSNFTYEVATTSDIENFSSLKIKVASSDSKKVFSPESENTSSDSGNSFSCDIKGTSSAAGSANVIQFHEIEARETGISDTEASESIYVREAKKFDMMKSCSVLVSKSVETEERFDNLDKSVSSKIFGAHGSNEKELDIKKNKPSIIASISLSKLGDRVANLKDIKNLAHNPELKRPKNNPKGQASKKVKKQKPDQPCCSSNRPCISSYFGKSCDSKRVRL